MNQYASAAEFKLELWPAGSSPDDLDDSSINDILEGVSRWVDNYTNTRFYSTTVDEARYYTSPHNARIYADDILSVTEIALDDGEGNYTLLLDPGDYVLMPVNSPATGWPYRWIETSPHTGQRFPLYRNAIRVTGRFGFCTLDTIPATIKRAVLIQATRLYKRKDAPFGVISNPFGGDMRLIADLDVDVAQLLGQYKRWL